MMGCLGKQLYLLWRAQMASRSKRIRHSISKTNEKYFYAMMCGLCKQPLKVRIAYCFDILFKRWKKKDEDSTRRSD